VKNERTGEQRNCYNERTRKLHADGIEAVGIYRQGNVGGISLQPEFRVFNWSWTEADARSHTAASRSSQNVTVEAAPKPEWTLVLPVSCERYGATEVHELPLNGPSLIKKVGGIKGVVAEIVED